MLITKTFRFRLAPTSRQRQLFSRYAGCCRFVFNRGLANRQTTYASEGRILSYAEQCKELPLLKRDEKTAWLAEVNAQVLQQVLIDLQCAYKHFFRRLKKGEPPGFPRFKKKGQQDSFRFPQGIKLKDGRVYLPKIGWVRYRNSRAVEGQVLQATVKREGQHWFVSLACEIETPDPVRTPLAKSKAIGVDVGLKSFAFLSDGTEVDNPRFLSKALPKLRKAQRRLSKKEKFSSNWRKQLAKVVQLHVKVKNSRRDFAHKLSTAIVKNHDVIAVEDLHIKGMVKNHHLSRAILDVGWASFLDMLHYKAEWAGKHYVRVGRFLATTQTCSTCGQKKPMPLSIRTYQCGGCGMVKNRDWNASLNIRAAGLAVLGFTPNACGGV